MMPPLRVVFLGSDPIALPMLNWLVGEGKGQATIVAVYTQPDRAVGRGQKIVPNEIKTWALAHGLLIYQPEKLDAGALAQLQALDADASLVMAYGHILRDEFIDAPRLGTLNFHASILPKFRGASPIQTAIAAGEKETGVSLMRIVRRLDAGPVADIERLPIEDHDTAAEIETKLAAACVPLLTRNLSRLADGSLAFVPQDDAAATYCRRLVKEDGALDFAASAVQLAARINGLFPWPACSIELNGQTIKLGLASAVDATSTQPAGTILGLAEGGLRVSTGAGQLALRRLQRPGGRMLDAAEFLRGFPVAPGLVVVSHPMAPLVGPAPFKR
jgi:methionyl-tRNA formyltransferase